MGVITGYTRRTAAIGSGGGGGAINTIYSASDTIADNARTVTLKSGGTASQYLQIANNGGGNLVKYYGSNLIDFGSTTNFVKPDFYLDSTLNDQFRLFSGSSAFANFNPNTTRYSLDMANPSTGAAISLSARFGQIAVSGRPGAAAGYYGFNSSSNQVITLDCQSDSNGYLLLKENNTGKIGLYAGYGNYFQDTVSIGQVYTFTAKLNVKGGGSTSATTTALFQNSASVSALTIKDDLYCIFRAKNAVIPDGDLSNNELSFYIEEATNDLHFKVKYSTGTVKSGKINLT